MRTSHRIMTNLIHTALTLVLATTVTGEALAQNKASKVGPSPAEKRVAKPLDRSGVRWNLPFATAVERAKRDRRMLMVVVIAGGTRPNGCW